MALENITELEKAIGIEEGKLSEMISSEEKHSIDLSSLLIEPKAIYEERLKNIKSDAATMAKEVTIKKIKNAFELEFEGKYEDSLIEAFKKRDETIKGEVIKDPEARYTTLKSDFDKLQSNLQEEINKRTELENGYAKKEKTNKIQNDVFKHIPDSTIVSKSTIIIEANQKGFTFDELDGITVVKDSNGEILKDERTLSPLGIDIWAKSFVTPYLKPLEGGSGKGDTAPPSKAGSFEAFEKEAEKNGWNASQINTEMSKRIKEGSLIL
jgi:hypothetical protein